MSVLVNPTTGVAGRKTSHSVAADGSVLFAVKWSPYEDFDEGGEEMVTATITQAADDLQFLVNAADDTGISAYTSATLAGAITYADLAADSIRETIDIINGIGAGQPGPLETGYMIRWRAGLVDFRPGFALGATSGLVVAAANAALGLHDVGLEVKGDTSGLEVAETYAVGLGTAKALSGGGQVFADHFESEYATDTSGNRFRVRSQGRRREEQPGLAEFRVSITEILADMVAVTSKTVSIYDIDDNLLGVFPTPVGAGAVPGISASSPFVGPSGSPLFVECVNVGGTTDGPLTVSGEIRIA